MFTIWFYLSNCKLFSKEIVDKENFEKSLQSYKCSLSAHIICADNYNLHLFI